MSSTKEVIVITGSSGRIGSHLIRKLADRYQIIGFDDGTPPFPPKPAHCIAFDIESDDGVQEALNQVRSRYGQRILAFVHLAAYYNFTGDPSSKYHSVNVIGTERILRALQAFEVGQFIFSSSMLVHAPQPPSRLINESSPLEPKWDYPQSKFDAEGKIFRAHGHVPSAILRIAGVYDDSCHLPALAQQIARTYERKLISHVFPGKSTHGQASIHMDDLIVAIDLLIETQKKLPTHQAFLLGEPETPSYARLQEDLGKLIHGEPWKTYEIPKVIAKMGAWLAQVVLKKDDEPFIKPWMIDLADDHFELDISLARSFLNWEPKHRLLTTLPKMIEILKLDPQAWYRTNDLEWPAGMQGSTPPTTTRHGSEVRSDH